MEELIKRLRKLMDDLDSGLAGRREPSDSIRLNGMNDILLAIEERVATLKYSVSAEHHDLLERA